MLGNSYYKLPVFTIVRRDDCFHRLVRFDAREAEIIDVDTQYRPWTILAVEVENARVTRVT